MTDELDEQEKKQVEEGVNELKDKDVESAEAKNLFLEASDLTIHLPSWLNPQHELFYKVSYLQVKKSPEFSSYPASVRTAMIKKLMYDLIVKMTNFFKKENEEKKEQERMKDESREY